MKSDKQRSAKAPGDPALASTLVSAEDQQDSAATTIPDAKALVKLGGPSPKSARPIVVKEVPVGTLFGNFEVVRKVGQGGMGVVYEAKHRTIGRKAAIKVMHHEWTRNPEYTQRFLNEARAVNIIQHPGLIEIFEYGQQPDGTLFIVMEFLHGESLEQRMHKQGLPRPEQSVVDIALQLARALTAAHEKGVIHRDLKPEIVSPVDTSREISLSRVERGGSGLNLHHRLTNHQSVAAVGQAVRRRLGETVATVAACW